MQYTNRDRVLALAGIFQACSLVQQVATRGQCEEAALGTAINSIFNTNPTNVEAVYGRALCLTQGLQSLVKEFDNLTRDRNLDLMKYVFGVLHLERKLHKKRELMEKLAAGITRAQQQTLHFPATHENILASLADTYSQTVSTLSPRIIVTGEHTHLANPQMANKVRACLLAAMRSAVLWRQAGGSRWSLLFGRGQLVAEGRLLLNELLR